MLFIVVVVVVLILLRLYSANIKQFARLLLFETLAKMGNIKACESVGVQLIHSSRWEDGIAYLETAAKAGRVEAMKWLATVYGLDPEYGGKCYKPDLEVHWLKEAVYKGCDVDSLYRLHFCYLIGEGVERDENKALDCLELAMKNGHMRAAVAYATNKYCVSYKETFAPEKAVGILGYVIDKGDVEAVAAAALQMGIIYGSGEIFRGEVKVAKELLALQDIAQAICYLHLGYMLDPDGLAGDYIERIVKNREYGITNAEETAIRRFEEGILKRLGREID